MPDKSRLSVVPPSSAAQPPPPPKKPVVSTRTWVAAAVALVVGGTLAGGLWYLSQDREPPGRPASNLPLFSVQSEPPGAEVAIDGRVLGQTPYFAQNELPPDAEAELTVTLSGYQPWSTRVRGGQEIYVTAELRRQKGRGGATAQGTTPKAGSGSMTDEALQPDDAPRETGRRKPLIAPSGPPAPAQ